MTAHIRSMRVTAHTELPPEVAVTAMLQFWVPNMFTKWGPVTAVVDIESQSPGWGEVGDHRRLLLGNGGSMVETITRLEPGRGYTLRSSNYDKAFEHYAAYIDDAWDFEAEGDGSRVTWTWVFHTTWAQQVFAFPQHMIWRAYMHHIMAKGMAQLSQVKVTH